MQHVTRRKLITSLAGTGVAASAGSTLFPLSVSSEGRNGFVDIQRAPDLVTAFTGLDHSFALQRSGSAWSAGGARVRYELQAAGMHIYVAAAGVEPTHLHIRWNAAIRADVLILGDAVVFPSPRRKRAAWLRSEDRLGRSLLLANRSARDFSLAQCVQRWRRRCSRRS